MNCSVYVFFHNASVNCLVYVTWFIMRNSGVDKKINFYEVREKTNIILMSTAQQGWHGTWGKQIWPITGLEEQGCRSRQGWHTKCKTVSPRIVFYCIFYRPITINKKLNFVIGWTMKYTHMVHTSSSAASVKVSVRLQQAPQIPVISYGVLKHTGSKHSFRLGG